MGSGISCGIGDIRRMSLVEWTTGAALVVDGEMCGIQTVFGGRFWCAALYGRGTMTLDDFVAHLRPRAGYVSGHSIKKSELQKS